MSDIAVVTGSVDISGNRATMKSLLLSEAVDRGMIISRISGAYQMGNNTSQEDAWLAGMSLQAGVSGDWISTVIFGPMTLGTGLISSGALYGAGTGDGGIADITGLVSNNWVSVVGYGLNDDFIFINPIITNTQRQ